MNILINGDKISKKTKHIKMFYLLITLSIISTKQKLKMQSKLNLASANLKNTNKRLKMKMSSKNAKNIKLFLKIQVRKFT